MARNWVELDLIPDGAHRADEALIKNVTERSSPACAGTLCEGASNAADTLCLPPHSTPNKGGGPARPDYSYLFRTTQSSFEPLRSPPLRQRSNEILEGLLAPAGPEDRVDNGTTMSTTIDLPC